MPQQLDTNILAHLLLTTKPQNRESGDFIVNDGRVVSRGGDWVYCGIALIHPRLFLGAPTGPFSLRDLFFAALASNQLSGQIHNGRWTDIGSLADYTAVQDVGI